MPYPAFVFASLAIAALTGATVAAARSRATAIVASFAGATALLLIAGLGFFRFFADDAFITFRYAHNLADGAGPNWNSDGRVEGYTNFLWMLIMTPFSKLGADLVVASQVLGMLAMLATLYAVFLLWQRWSDDEPASGIGSPAVLATTLAGIALTGAVPFWGFAGMETALFTALITFGAYRHVVEQRRDAAAPWSAFVFAAAALTRPEGLIAAFVTGAFVLAGALDPERRPLALRRAIVWCAAFAAIFVPYFVWRYAYYDYLLPNTFYAKVEPTRALFDRGLDYVWTYGTRYLLPAMFVGAAFLLTKPSLRRDAAYVMALCGALLAGVVLEGGESFPHGRLVAPVLPLMYAAGVAGLAAMLKHLPLTGRQPALIATFALSLAALSLLRGSHDLLGPIVRERDALHEREALGRWLHDNTPEDYTIAAFAVGAIGYESERDVLDMLGLNDTTIAHTDVPGLGTGFGGHEKYNIDYVLDTVRPEIIVLNDGEPRAFSEEELRERANVPSPVPARDRLFGDPRLWERYDVRSLELDGVWFNFLQRADTVSELEAPGLR